MHAVLYKVCEMSKVDTKYEIFDTTEIMNEFNLREFYRKQVELGYIAPKNLKDHDLTVLDDPQDIDIDAIFEVLNDNDEYNKDHDYFVEQVCVRLGDYDYYD